MPPWGWIVVVPVAALVAAWAVSSRRRGLALERVFADADEAPPAPRSDADEFGGPLARWLLLSGDRRPDRATRFVVASLVSALVGLVAGLVVLRSGVVETLEVWVAEVPGGLGLAFTPVFVTAPFVLFVGFALLPTLVVRARRRRIVREVEVDLPVTLELLSTQAVAGLGLDAAMARIVERGDRGRALSVELSRFQRETLSGISRTRALRRLAQRIDVPAVSVFASSLIQAEGLGASLSSTLRRQAEEMRSRRRERALLLAQGLPVKLVFPLVICFLPAIFLFTLGPAFHQFFELASSIIEGAS